MTGPNDPNQPGPPGGGEPQYRPDQYPGQQGYPPQQYPAQQYPGQQQYPPQQYPGQQYPGPQQYPGEQYPGQPYPGQQQFGAAPPAQRVALWQRLGPRALHRPQPRLGVTLGGVGVALIVIGVFTWSFTYLIEGFFSDASTSQGGAPDDSRKFLGAALSALVVAGGYTLIVRANAGTLRTAGIVASALGVPALMEFLTLDLTSRSVVNTDAVFWVSVPVYLISYLFVRGARGHVFYLGLSLLQIWGYVLDKVDGSALNAATGAGVRAFPGLNGASLPNSDFSATTIGVTSLIVGFLYFGAAFVLDRGGRHGVAVAFVIAGLPAVALGIGALAADLEAIGTGILLIVVGFAIAAYGARFERRFTTWFWAAAGASGFVVIVTDAADTGTSAGIWLIVIGIAVVVAGWRIAPLLHEPPDIDEGVDAPAVAAPRQH